MLHMLLMPFADFGFMRRALMGCIAISLSAAPLGVFMLLRRMTLVGDALSHAILPGVAAGYLLSGMSLASMGAGGFIAGLIVALLSGLVSQRTVLKEDASFAGFYLGSLALGVTLVSMRGSNADLLHVLFGSILAIDSASLLQIGAICTFSLLTLAVIFRVLVIASFDMTFLRAGAGHWQLPVHALSLGLVVLNLVAGFQVLGTLMSVGLLVLPATCARFWSNSLSGLIVIAVITGILSSLIGLELSFYLHLPAGPAIVLTAALAFCFSVCFGRCGGIFRA